MPSIVQLIGICELMELFASTNWIVNCQSAGSPPHTRFQLRFQAFSITFQFNAELMVSHGVFRTYITGFPVTFPSYCGNIDILYEANFLKGNAFSVASLAVISMLDVDLLNLESRIATSNGSVPLATLTL